MPRAATTLLVSGAAVLALLLLSAGDTLGADVPNRALDRVMAKYIEQQMGLNNIPGLSLAAFKNHEVIWSRGFGRLNVDAALGNTTNNVSSDTLFNLASISKTVVAVAMMQLLESDSLPHSLDDPINRYLPFPVVNPFAPDVDITIRHLMTHTSSIQDNFDVINAGYRSCWDVVETLGGFMDNYFTPGSPTYSPDANFYAYPPGDAWNYSNAATSLLAYLVERISGQLFKEYVAEHIFAQASMPKSTYMPARTETDIATPLVHACNRTILRATLKSYFGVTSLEGVFVGHPNFLDIMSFVKKDSCFNHTSYVQFTQYCYPDYPDGGLRTNVNEYASFFLNLIRSYRGNYTHEHRRDDRLLKGDTISAMWQVQYPYSTDADLQKQALTWYYDDMAVGSEHIMLALGHDGSDMGISTKAFWLPESRNDLGVIIFTNGDHNGYCSPHTNPKDCNLPTARIADTVLNWMHEGVFKPPPQE